MRQSQKYNANVESIINMRREVDEGLQKIDELLEGHYYHPITDQIVEEQERIIKCYKSMTYALQGMK